MGLLHIYCGDGKGKTTAALGLALRAAGAGMKVRIVQFMKGGDTAELCALQRLPEVSVLRCSRAFGFLWELDDAERAELTDCHNALLKAAFSGDADVIVLDEFNLAYGEGLMDRTLAGQLIADAGARCEIVLTGRDPAECFVQRADYISEIRCVRHPFDQGIGARYGIEF